MTDSGQKSKTLGDIEVGLHQDGNLASGEIQKQNIGGKLFVATHRKLIMQEDLNAAGRLFGGRLMEWVDEAAALFCMTEIASRAIVTKKISEVIFNEPANLGDVLEFVFRVRQAGQTSITIEALVIAMAITETEHRRLIVQCDLVFVALDPQGKPKRHGYILKE